MSNVVKHHEPPAARARAFDMAEVGEEAQALLASAEESARRIIAEAEAKAEALGRDAWEHGFAEGRRALIGRVEREIADDLRRVRTEEVDAAVRALKAAVGEVCGSRDRLVRESKDQLIALAVNIARLIVKREIAASSDVARLNLDEAIRLSARGTKLVVRVSEADVQTLHAFLGEHASLAGENASVEIVPSSEVEPGGCLVESASGSVDARIETQFREIEKVLFGPNFAEATSGKEAVHGG